MAKQRYKKKLHSKKNISSNMFCICVLKQYIVRIDFTVVLYTLYQLNTHNSYHVF